MAASNRKSVLIRTIQFNWRSLWSQLTDDEDITDRGNDDQREQADRDGDLNGKAVLFGFHQLAAVGRAVRLPLHIFVNNYRR